MNKIKAYFRERLSGFLLLFLAGIIIIGIYVSSGTVQLKNDLAISSESQNNSQKDQLLGDEKEENKSDSTSNSKEILSDKAKLLLITDGDDKSYEISVSSGISVIDAMDLLQKDISQNFSYHNSSGFIDKIIGISNESNMSWMLYLCKGGICKLSSTGASECKIDGWDRIEWRYVDWTKMDWITW